MEIYPGDAGRTRHGMPEMDGYELLQRARAMRSRPKVAGMASLLRLIR